MISSIAAMRNASKFRNISVRAPLLVEREFSASAAPERRLTIELISDTM